MQDPTQLTADELEDVLVERCITDLLDLERRYGTRVLALASDEITQVDTDETGYSERKWAALPEMRERIAAYYRAFEEAGEGKHTPKPVTATPLPTSAEMIREVSA